jgi:hypothetical protein
MGKIDFDQEGGEMMIGGVSSVSSTMTMLNPVVFAKPSPGASIGAAPATASAKVSSNASASTPASSGASASTRAASSAGAHGGGASASAAGRNTAEEMVSGFSTTVGGTPYFGSVEESGAEYTASVPNLAGATASGSSEQAAENDLDARIDELV